METVPNQTANTMVTDYLITGVLPKAQQSSKAGGVSVYLHNDTASADPTILDAYELPVDAAAGDVNVATTASAGHKLPKSFWLLVMVILAITCQW
jgi:hypothetical protein